jgi:hypothetical protein
VPQATYRLVPTRATTTRATRSLSRCCTVLTTDQKVRAWNPAEPAGTEVHRCGQQSVSPRPQSDGQPRRPSAAARGPRQGDGSKARAAQIVAESQILTAIPLSGTHYLGDVLLVRAIALGMTDNGWGHLVADCPPSLVGAPRDPRAIRCRRPDGWVPLVASGGHGLPQVGTLGAVAPVAQGIEQWFPKPLP